MAVEADPIELAVAPYPALLWTARHGALAGWVVTLLPLLMGSALALERRQPWWLVAGVTLAAIIGMAARLVLELVRLLVETLIPR